MIGYLCILAWLFLLCFWGGFWRADQRLRRAPDLTRWPSVVAIIPARDEAASIGEVVQAHRATDYPGHLDLIVVDDSSSDGTGDIARAAGASVIHAPPLEAGWSGKLWSLQSGLEHPSQSRSDAEWILFTDADILHKSDTLRRLVAHALVNDLALASLMARLDNRGFWGRLLIPAFVFFFQKLYPFAWVNRPGHWCAAAAGGCVLIRREALEEIGGIAAIRDALIDDCALAAKVKNGPPARKIWLGLATDEVISLRDNRALSSIWTMVSRTAFTQLRHSILILAGSVAGMVFLYLTGPALFVAGLLGADLEWGLQGLAIISLMAIAYRPILRMFDQSAWHALLLPLAGALYSAMTVSSAINHLRGTGGAWKGRTYP